MDAETYLEQKGAPELLATLHVEEVARFTDLQEAVGISTKTLQKRIDTAVAIDLLDSTREIEYLSNAETGKTRRRGTHVYILTERGHVITREMARRGLVRLAQKKRTLEEEFDAGVDELIESLEDDTEHLIAAGTSDIPQEKLRERRRGLDLEDSDEGGADSDGTDRDSADPTDTRE